LNKKISNGSGFDIASARSDKPILYKQENGSRKINPVSFYPKFSNQLYLVWLGNKKGTEQSIKWYRRHIHPTINEINSITNITNEIW
ncbi:MAG: GHMP kinase, partial [Mariniphaga sp.]|nr:GHMP kinase [Mariniphaga sp.]